jgi:membrane-bound lytic murein transglycosylase B
LAYQPASTQPRALPAIGPTAWCFAAQIGRAMAVAAFLFMLAVVGMASRAHAASEPFDRFVAHLWPDAHRMGVSRPLFDRAFAGMTPDDGVLEKTHRQAEFVKPIGDYLAKAVSDKRIARGREMLATWGTTLARIERIYGVDRHVVLGVWGMETNFGSYTGDRPVIRSLATLAAAGYRGAYFRHELLKALVILQQGHVALQDFTGSWAGAMGQTQFMPTSFQAYAVDFDGDGHKNIWTSVPDALASTANYLAKHGWRRGLAWGTEVVAPQHGALPRQASLDFKPMAHWHALGLTRPDGDALPAHGEAALIVPAGGAGPAFLVGRNFKTIKTYNNSTAYALGVALLGDRIAGNPELHRPWPVVDARR